VLAAYFYVFMEWLFFVTKPSFTAPMGGWERAAVFFGTAPLAALSAALATSSLGVLARMLPERAGSLALRWLAFAVPAAVLAACLFLLIDNFTYTIFHFGVLTARGLWRLPYALLIAGFWVWLLRKFARASFSVAADRRLVWATAGLVLCSALTWIAQYAASEREARAVRTGDLRGDRMPDILLLGSDGVEASHMSVYGFKRDTTPFLRTRINEALIVENAYPNATRTSGSLVSMLTGKLATHTRVYEQFGILKGRDAFEHLPGILRDLGYRSIHVSAFLFADPSAMRRPWNMRNAFDDYECFAVLPLALAVPYSANVYFFGEMIDRIDARVLHAMGFKTDEPALAEIVSARSVTDEQRIEAVLDFMEASQQPVFAHLHLLGTHPPYELRRRFFTEGKTRRGKRRDDYDSSIRTFDERVEGIFDRLRRTGRLDDTVIVLTSDHGRGWKFVRVPLIFFFPNGEHRGVVASNAQLLDVAPTLVDYLGLAIPEWMEGESLLKTAPDPQRPILSVDVVPFAPPPFPNIGHVGVTVCDQTSWLAPRVGSMNQEPVRGHTGPCDPSRLPRPAALRAMLVADLEHSGYDVSRLRTLPRGSRPGALAPRTRER
jgi:hypothetical protein